LGEPGALERSTTIYRDCFRSIHPVDPIPAELLPKAVAARMRETTFRLDDGRPDIYSCTYNDAFRPDYDHRNTLWLKLGLFVFVHYLLKL